MLNNDLKNCRDATATKGTLPAVYQSNDVVVIVPGPVTRLLPLRSGPYGDQQRSAALAPSRSREPILPSGILSFYSAVGVETL